MPLPSRQPNAQHYTDAGLLKTETNPEQGVTTYDYDQAGRKTGITQTVRHADGSQSERHTSLTPTVIGQPGERVTQYLDLDALGH